MYRKGGTGLLNTIKKEDVIHRTYSTNMLVKPLVRVRFYFTAQHCMPRAHTYYMPTYTQYTNKAKKYVYVSFEI
jgi:hypothetical protein